MEEQEGDFPVDMGDGDLGDEEFDINEPLPLSMDEEDLSESIAEGHGGLAPSSIAATPSIAETQSTPMLGSNMQSVAAMSKRFIELYRSAQQHPAFPLITQAAMGLLRKKLEARGVNVDALIKNYNRFGEAAATMGPAVMEFAPAVKKFGSAALSTYRSFGRDAEEGSGEADEGSGGEGYEMADFPDVGETDDTEGLAGQFEEMGLDEDDVPEGSLVY